MEQLRDIGPFKRGQIEAALWRMMVRSQDPSLIPQVFRTRVKRLLDIDRKEQVYESEVMKQRNFAFSDEAPVGRGADALYSSFDVFCLGVGLDLLDLGFKQAETVFFLQNVRADLRGAYQWIMNNPPAPRQHIPTEDRPNCPSYDYHRIRIADCRIYMRFTKVELKELFFSAKPNVPFFFRPDFFYGIEHLGKELRKRQYDDRKSVLMELADFAVLLHEKLASTPPTPRGRPRLR